MIPFLAIIWFIALTIAIPHHALLQMQEFKVMKSVKFRNQTRFIPLILLFSIGALGGPIDQFLNSNPSANSQYVSRPVYSTIYSI